MTKSKFRNMNSDEKKFFDTIKRSKEREYNLPAMDYAKLEKKFGKHKAEKISNTFFQSGIMFEPKPKRVALLQEKHGMVYKNKLRSIS